MNKFILLFTFLCFLNACAKKEPAKEVTISLDEISIRYARDLSNKAIAEKDTMAIDKVWMDNFFILSSGDEMVEGKAKNRKLFVDTFQSRPDAVYVRTPDQIHVYNAWNMASEMGTWEGSWTGSEGKVEVGGTYYAKWHKVKSQWLLRAEIFTATYCRGGAFCASQPINN